MPELNMRTEIRYLCPIPNAHMDSWEDSDERWWQKLGLRRDHDHVRQTRKVFINADGSDIEVSDWKDSPLKMAKEATSDDDNTPLSGS